MKKYFSQFLESDGIPSIRLASGLLMVLLVIALEIRFSTPQNVQSMIDADLVFVGSLFAIGATRMAAQSFAARPPEPAAQLNAEQAEVKVAGDLTIQGNSEQP